MSDTDLVVIGGGILGAGVAQCAAAAGFKVAVIEKNSIARATSANSSKLIHGGLRYLETAQIKLIYESLSERASLIKHAEPLVRPVKFYIPVYQSGKRKPWQLFLGLSAYYFLSGFSKYGRFKSVPEHQWQQVTAVNKRGLVGLFQYWDAQTDDHQLALSVVDSAKKMGAEVYEYHDCINVLKQERGYSVEAEHAGKKVNFNAKCVVNAAGPWGTEVLKRLSPQVPDLEVDLVLGSHILLDIPAVEHILYIESHLDSRVIFVMPWYGRTLVGTTEKAVDTVPETFSASEQEIDYLCEIYAHYFNDYSVNELKLLIVKTFCGARVLPKTSLNPFRRSRDTLMKSYDAHPDMLTILGGKLTTYRVTAKQTVKWLERRLGKRERVADFSKIKLRRVG